MIRKRFAQESSRMQCRSRGQDLVGGRIVCKKFEDVELEAQLSCTELPQFNVTVN
jgi:hypothetical protein